MHAIIATNPQEMQEAQGTTISWIVRKLDDARLELREAEQVAESLGGANLRRSQAANLVKKARRRVGFYEKVHAALAAGYYIIPPFDIQLFAIRTDRLQSPDEVSRNSWANEQTSRSLPVGEGRFVSPVVGRHEFDRYTENVPGTEGKTREVILFQNDDWRDVVLPVRALKPTIIEATGKALQEKIFDALGIAPAYRAADPIIAGQIKRPDGKGVITFFVAWWLDEKDL